jgi:glycosidase
MLWVASAGAGFTTAEPWLPLGAAERANVYAQREDPASLLRLYRELIALRRRTPALHSGSYATLAAPEGVFAWERRADASCARVALNLGDEAREVDLGPGEVGEFLSTDPQRAARRTAGKVELEPAEGVVCVLT